MLAIFLLMEKKIHCGDNGLLARQVCQGPQEELSLALCHLWAVGFVAGESYIAHFTVPAQCI